MTGSFLVSLLAVAIALLGASIAWAQWHLARQKLILDLFDKRYKQLERFEAAIDAAEMTDVMTAPLEAYAKFRDIAKEMQWLFGDDVEAHIQSMLNTSAEGRMLEHQRANLPIEVLRPLIDGLASDLEAKRNAFDALKKELRPLFHPYLRMRQTLPRTPWQWLMDRPAWVRQKWTDLLTRE